MKTLKKILVWVTRFAVVAAITIGIAYLFVEAATGECVGASYCDKINGK